MKFHSAVLTLPLTFHALAYPISMEKRDSITTLEDIMGGDGPLSPRNFGEEDGKSRADFQANSKDPDISRMTNVTGKRSNLIRREAGTTVGSENKAENEGHYGGERSEAKHDHFHEEASNTKPHDIQSASERGAAKNHRRHDGSSRMKSKGIPSGDKKNTAKKIHHRNEEPKMRPSDNHSGGQSGAAKHSRYYDKEAKIKARDINSGSERNRSKKENHSDEASKLNAKSSLVEGGKSATKHYHHHYNDESKLSAREIPSEGDQVVDSFNGSHHDYDEASKLSARAAPSEEQSATFLVAALTTMMKRQS